MLPLIDHVDALTQSEYWYPLAAAIDVRLCSSNKDCKFSMCPDRILAGSGKRMPMRVAHSGAMPHPPPPPDNEVDP